MFEWSGCFRFIEWLIIFQTILDNPSLIVLGWMGSFSTIFLRSIVLILPLFFFSLRLIGLLLCVMRIRILALMILIFPSLEGSGPF